MTPNMTLAAGLAILTLTGEQAQAADCGDWGAEDTFKATENTYFFFKTASAEDIQVCLDAGANINARTTGMHVSDMTYSNGKVTMAGKTITGNWVEVLGLAAVGMTPLDLATLYNKNPAVIKALLDAGADASLEDITGKLPVDLIDED